MTNQVSKVLFLCAGLMISAVAAGQKTLKITEKDMTGVIFRYVGDNETVVEVQSNVKLEFESTMDKAVNVYKTYEESGFFFYELLFPTHEKMYDGRKLKIMSYGFQYHYEPLDLKPKIPVGLFVYGSKTELEGRNVAIQRFTNETAYGRSRLIDNDMGQQAVTILSTKLASTKKFILLESPDKDLNREDLQIADYQMLGVDYLIMGTITEFGRKNETVRKRKYQIAQTSISIRLIDVSTGQVVFAEEAKGEAKTDGRTVDYDATLPDKAISDAISKLVNSINNLFN